MTACKHQGSYPSLKTFLEKFYAENQTRLQANYPGLSLNRLKQELETLAHRMFYPLEHFWRAPHLQHHSNLVHRFFSDLLAGIPIEYITGRSYFHSDELGVTTEVLIPRSETEQLVELALEHIRSLQDPTRPRILEVGIGSGAIALSLLRQAKRPLEIHATDLSPQALRVAQRNYFGLQYGMHGQSELKLYHTDRMQALLAEATNGASFELIVTNPPYIKARQDLAKVHQQVLKHEPALALFLNDDEYDAWFRLLFSQAFKLLLDKGRLIMEGHEDHLEQLRSIASTQGFKQITIRPDLTGRARFIDMLK